jgi:hypothetical protein
MKGNAVPPNEIALYGIFAVLALPACTWYMRQAQRLSGLVHRWFRQFRSRLRKSGLNLLRWLLAEGDEEDHRPAAMPARE